MPRKAINVLVRRKLAKNTPVTLAIMENYLEPHFAAIQEDSDVLRQEVKQEIGQLRSEIGQLSQSINEKYETTLRAILEILTGHKKEIRSIREDNWSLEKRVLNLEKQLV